MSATRRRRRPCKDCGRPSKGQRCRDCYVTQERIWHDSPEVLEDGRWITRGLVRVWMEAS